jgi:hypothetical protein
VNLGELEAECGADDSQLPDRTDGDELGEPPSLRMVSEHEALGDEEPG